MLLPAAVLAVPAQDHAPPIAYEHRRTNDPLSIHIAQVQPERVRIIAALAGAGGFSRDPVSRLARREQALLAINGGFFKIGEPDDGEPAGILRIGGEWVSDSPLPRGALGWKGNGLDVAVGQLATRWHLQAGTETQPVTGINRFRSARDVIVYTPPYGPSTRTARGPEWIVRRDRIFGFADAGDNVIPADGYVVSFGSAALPALAPPPGTPVRLNCRFEGPDAHLAWNDMDFVVGGTPVLVRDGRLVADFSSEQVRRDFLVDRHPRTAVGIREDGTWVLVVVDGRRPEYSIGMTMTELAEFMLSLGCRQALNLDGGGSSTFWIYGQLVNRPSDLAGERPVSDAILVLPE